MNSAFDAPYTDVDSTPTGEQILLPAASQAAIANIRQSSAFNQPNGASAQFHSGGISASYSNSSNYDVSTAFPTYQIPPALPPANVQSSQDTHIHIHGKTTSHQFSNPTLKLRQQNFLHGVASVMNARGTPLPPTLTGVSTPSYDPNSSVWKSLEVSSEVGSIRLVGRDINLLNLWASVFQSGGGYAVSANKGWESIIAQFDLPDEIPSDSPGIGSTPVAQTVANYYMAILHPFEQHYRNNILEQQKKVAAASRQSGSQVSHPGAVQIKPVQMIPGGAQISQMSRGSAHNSMGVVPGGSHASLNDTSNNVQDSQINRSHVLQCLTESSTSNPRNSSEEFQNEVSASDISLESNVNDQEIPGIKRKLEEDEGDGKPARQKIRTEPLEPTLSGAGSVDNSSDSTVTSLPTLPSRPQQQPRQKIEYVPLARELDTYGGRNLKTLEHNFGRLSQRRPIRDMHDWGVVDIEHLTMSLRSRLSIELSYALTTFTYLSTLRGPTPDSGFPISQCPDLLEEMLDLLEDTAFGDFDGTTEINSTTTTIRIATNRELVRTAQESQGCLFSESSPSQVKFSTGPQQRPGNIVLAIVNIIRNLCAVAENSDFISRHTRLLDLVLRVCGVTREESGIPSPSSSALSLADLILFRKDTLFILATIAGRVRLSAASPNVRNRVTNRVFQLIVSYLIDPAEATSPLAFVQLNGGLQNEVLKPPLLADVGLEAFSRLSQMDSNRQVLAKSIPQEAILCFFEALVHRLPVVDADFQLIRGEMWMSYLEKVIMAIYSLAFLSPPDVKDKVKANRTLGFKSIMFRMIQKFLASVNPDGQNWFTICTRRAIEALKVLDNAEDSFDPSQSVIPTMSFGMGFNEVGDKEFELGTGLLAGHRGLAWNMLMLREVYSDEVTFRELESLSRVECCK